MCVCETNFFFFIIFLFRILPQLVSCLVLDQEDISNMRSDISNKFLTPKGGNQEEDSDEDGIDSEDFRLNEGDSGVVAVNKGLFENDRWSVRKWCSKSI